MIIYIELQVVDEYTIYRNLDTFVNVENTMSAETNKKSWRFKLSRFVFHSDDITNSWEKSLIV